MAQTSPAHDERLAEMIWGIKACEEAVDRLRSERRDPRVVARVEDVRTRLLLQLAAETDTLSLN